MLIARSGASELTLSAVADEAGLARATMYGYFSSKRELLAALVAKEPQSETAAGDEPVAAAGVPPPIALPLADAPIRRLPQASPQCLAPVAVSTGEAPARDALAETLVQQDERRQLQAAHLEEIARRLILPDSALKEGTAAVIARLETRMRVLETSLTTLETRHSGRDAEEQRMLKPLSDLIAELQTQIEASKTQQLEMAAALRLELHELATELDLTRQGKAGPPKPIWPKLAVDYPIATEPKPAAAAVALLPDSENPANRSYLAAARVAAQDVARRDAEQEAAVEAERRGQRRRIFVAAGVVLGCLMVVGMFFQLHAGPQQTSTVPAGEPPHRVLARASRPLSMLPFARLTARAKAGDAKAQLVVGLKYLDGDGVAENDAGAARWIAMSARQGYAVAENYLGALYQHGRGVAANSAQAMYWYEAAANQGDRHAMSNLGVLFASAHKPDFAEAARWFLRAAQLGHVDAQFNLAVLYERGDGVPQSLLDAYKWYAIAAASGDRAAKIRAEAIATQITPAELQAAESASTEFKVLPLNRAVNELPASSALLARR